MNESGGEDRSDDGDGGIPLVGEQKPSEQGIKQSRQNPGANRNKTLWITKWTTRRVPCFI